MIDYRNIYTKDYFEGKNSGFYKFLGYRNYRYFNHYYNIIKPYAEQKSKVLDVGCAFGFLLKRFAQNGHAIWGLDIAEHAITSAKKQVPQGTFLVHGAEDTFPFDDSFFDVIIMIDVLEHLEYPEMALQNAARTLKSSGLLFVAVPNKNLLRKIFLSIPDKLDHHISLQSIEETRNMLKETGFVVIDSWTAPTPFLAQTRIAKCIGLESYLLARKKELLK